MLDDDDGDDVECYGGECWDIGPSSEAGEG